MKTLLCVILMLSTVAQAYDEDTHFYGTYTMARFAGIKQEVALKIALTTQWMDESYISDPTSMIILPITGIKKRRLLHFPSSRITGSVNTTSQQEVVGLDKIKPMQKMFIDEFIKRAGIDNVDISGLTFMTETKEEHPFANQLLMEGLKNGNLMMASASLHTLEDSYAHAGTPAEQGHASFWHWPDRPYASMPKYFRMTKGLFKALAAIRLMLPPQALDCKINFSGSKPNCQLTASELANLYNQNPDLISTVSRNVLNENEYIQVAAKDFLERAVKSQYIKFANAARLSEMTSQAQIQKYMNEISQRGESADSYLVLELIIRDLVSSNELDTALVLNNMGLVKANKAALQKATGKPENSVTVAEYISAFGENEKEPDVTSEGFKIFVKGLAQDLLRWAVPSPLDHSHRFELEADKSPIRKKEMDMRILGMQKLIEKFYGEKIEFVKNNTSDKNGFILEINASPQAEQFIANKKPGVIYATFNGLEKKAFDFMILKYLYPSLSNDDLKLIVETTAKVDQTESNLEKLSHTVSAVHNTDESVFLKALDFAGLIKNESSNVASLVGFIHRAVGSIQHLIKNYKDDTFKTGITPSEDNHFYRNTYLFVNYRKQGIIQPLLGDQDIWKTATLKLN